MLQDDIVYAYTVFYVLDHVLCVTLPNVYLQLTELSLKKDTSTMQRDRRREIFGNILVQNTPVIS